MSTLSEEILRLETAKANIDNALISRGVTIPNNATLDTYHELINSIKGGTSSEEVTATKANVLAGTTTITSDSNDEIVEGTMPNYSGTRQDTDGVWIGDGYINMSVKNPGYYAGDSDLRAIASDFGNAAQANVLSGETFTSSNGIKLSGTMPNRGGSTNTKLTTVAWYNSNQSLLIQGPYGYYASNNANGDFDSTIAASSAASSLGITAAKILKGNSIGPISGTATSDATATAAQIISGKTAWVNGAKLTGSMANQGAQTKTITPSSSAQTYTIPAGYHNGSGKITINAIPSTYVSLSGGLTFFSDGVFGDWVKNLGLGNRYPFSISDSDGDGWYTPSQFSGTGDSISLSTLISSRFGLTIGNVGSSSARKKAWCTRKTIDFTNLKTMSISIGYGSSSATVNIWFYNVSTGLLRIVSFNGASPGDYDISKVTGQCTIGGYASSATVYLSKLVFKS